MVILRREYVDHAFQYILPKWECAAKSARVKQREKCLMFQDAWAMEQVHSFPQPTPILFLVLQSAWVQRPDMWGPALCVFPCKHV